MLKLFVQVIVVGNGGVGKTSMIKRFCTGTFSGEYKKTIGVDFLQKKVFVPSQSETVTMDLWDTAGQERFRTIASSYYRGAHGIIIVYDVTDRSTFENVKHWIGEIDRYSNAHVGIIRPLAFSLNLMTREHSVCIAL